MPQHNPTARMLGPQKAAHALIILGEQASAEILKQLDESEVELLSREVARVGSIAPEQAEAVLDEFHRMTLAHDYVLKGGVEYAKKLLVSAFGADAARQDRFIKALGPDPATGFDALQKADPQQLAKLIATEHPQTIALILSHLNPSQAAVLLSSLPTELRHDVAVRMANLERTSPEVIGRIAAIIGRKFKLLGDVGRETCGGVRAVAEMCNRLDPTSTRDILERIEESDPNLAADLRQYIFVFEDLITVGAAAIKEVLARLDRKVLTVALKGTGEELRKHFLACMSQRGAEMLVEDMDALGPVRIRDVEAAQQQVVALARQLETDVTITLKADGGEQYVL